MDIQTKSKVTRTRPVKRALKKVSHANNNRGWGRGRIMAIAALVLSFATVSTTAFARLDFSSDTITSDGDLTLTPQGGNQSVVVNGGLAIVPASGEELVTNGGFSGSASGWTLGEGWNYNAGKVTHTPSNNGILQTASVALDDARYQITFDLTGATQGELCLWTDGADLIEDFDSDDSGTQVVSFAPGDPMSVSFIFDVTCNNDDPSGDFDGSIDNFSVKEQTGMPVVINAGGTGVGIGTYTPSEDFQFVGERALFNSLMIGEGGANIEARDDNDLVLRGGDSSKIIVGSEEDDSSIGFYTSGLEDDALRMYIDSDGNVGIGTDEPAFLMDVNGSVNATDYNVDGTPGYDGTCPSGSNLVISHGIITGCLTPPS